MRLARAGVRNSALRIVLAVLPMVALASGCQASGSGTSGASGSLTVAVVPGIDNAPLRVAAQKGLFRQHGMQLHRFHGGPGEQLHLRRPQRLRR